MAFDSVDGVPRMSEADANLGCKDKSGYRDSDEPLTDRSCVRCAHYVGPDSTGVEVGFSAQFAHSCRRPQLGSTLDLVVGSEVPITKDAYAERATNLPDACGPEGKFWSQSGF